MSTVFKNGMVIDVINETIQSLDILVENDRITQIGKDLKADTTVDLAGQYVMPGLFNCHVHMCMPPDPAVNYQLSDATRTVKTLGHLKQYLASGTTFIRDVGGFNYIDIDLRELANTKQIVAPHMQVSGKNICMTGGHGWQMGREADGVDDCRKASREQLKAGADWIKVMATGGVMTKGVEPGASQLSEEEMRAIIEEAHKVGKKTCTHAQGMEGIKNALRAGIDSIEHGFYMDDWCFEFMKENRVFLVPTLAAPYWIKEKGTAAGIPAYAVEKVHRTMDDHKATFQKAYQAGVQIALGTDAGTPLNPHDKTAFEAVLMHQAGMTSWDILKAATIQGAKLCDVQDKLGSIEVGKLACLAIFKDNPINKVETLLDCQMTVLDGQIVHQK